MNSAWHGFALLAVVCTGLCSADVLTPSTSANVPAPSLDSGEKISFEAAAGDLAAVFPIRMTEYSQVVQHSYNWRGPEDASLQCDIGFTPTAIVIRGEFRDDVPFYQTMTQPAMPDWWRIRYGADGIEFTLDDPTSPALRLNFALNLSSRATDPRVDILASPPGKFRGIMHSADFDIGKNYTEAGTIQFRAAIPIAPVAETKFFTGRLRITARLHDMDGDPATYLMMQEVIEKK